MSSFWFLPGLVLAAAGCVWLAVRGGSAVKRIAGMLAEFMILWYLGAMANFFPFMGDDFGVRAAGYTGLLICLNLGLCAGWIVEELRKTGRGKEDAP